jgi:hypothetical protein
MKINLDTVDSQIYVTPYIKITYSRILNSDYELIIGWLKWQLVIGI